MRHNALFPVVLLAVLPTLGCEAPNTEPEAGDDRDDAFLGGPKADGGVDEGSSEALAVLELVNTADEATLDDSDAVGLDARAARGIHETRVGPDGLEGTDDDAPFASLAELDAVPYVGPVAFDRLLAYALDQGYGPDPDDPAFTEADIRAGIVRLANTATFELLDDTIGLDRRAASGISAGAPFDDVEAIDAVPYVGPSALTRLREYALEGGYVRAYDDMPIPHCEGDFTATEVQQAYNSEGWIGFALHRFERRCDFDGGQTTCTPWSALDVPEPDQVYGGDPQAPFTTEITVAGDTIGVNAYSEAGSIYRAEGTLAQTGEGTELELAFEYRGYTHVCDEFGWNTFTCLRSHNEYWSRDWMTLRGEVTESCAVLSSNVEQTDGVSFGSQTRSYTETVTMAESL